MFQLCKDSDFFELLEICLRLLKSFFVTLARNFYLYMVGTPQNSCREGGTIRNITRLGGLIAPWIVGLVAFFAVSYIFYAPQFDGLSLGQGDIAQYAGMSQDIREHRASTGEDPQWTGNMFSGMPAYLIDVEYPAQEVKRSIGSVVKIVDGPMNMTLFAMLLMMVAVVLMGVNPWIGIIAGLAYGLSTYFFLIIDAGHITKMWALVYAPPLVAAVWYALRRNMWVGATLAALFGSLELGANHPQITYYFLLACAALWINELWFSYKDKTLKSFGRRTALLALAAVLAVGSNIAPLWYTMRHSSYTTRGVSEASNGEDAREEKIAYNTAWSYGIKESGNMLVPNYMGAWSGDYNEKAIKVLQSRGAQEAMFNDALNDLTKILRQQMPDITRRDVEYILNMGDEQLLDDLYYLLDVRSSKATRYATNYWGEQPYTAGPTYLGAAAILLAILGAILTSARNRWWIVAVTLFALLLAWGSNIMGFYELMFDLLPGYDNFRTVSMALVVVEWSVPLLAVFALNELVCSTLPVKQLRRSIVIATGIVVALVVAMLLLADYGVKDIYDELGEALWVEQLREAVVEARRGAAVADALRSILYVVALDSILWTMVGLRRGAMYKLLIAIVALIVVADLVGVDKRYLGEDKWHKGTPMVMTPTAADKEIMADKDLGFRVLDLTTDPYNSARASYFHRSVGGYHGAKLGRYQEVIDKYLKSYNSEVLAALNVCYVITSEGVVSLEQFSGYEPNGAAWLVEGVVRGATAKEALELVGDSDLLATAVVEDGVKLSTDSFNAEGDIALVEYSPNRLVYEYSADSPSLAVFSEIYFADGWRVYVDGEEADYFAVDYILRGMELSAGEHTIVWQFRAPRWAAISAVMAVASWLILAALVAVIVVMAYRTKCNEGKKE